MINKHATAALVLLATLTATGCAITPAPAPAEHAPVKVRTVYIAPNCQTIGPESICNWIVPNGPEADEPTQPAKVVDGISL